MYFSLYSTFLITWGLLFVIFCGCGIWIARGFKIRVVGYEQIFLALWVGFAAVLAVLQIWNFIFPVNTAIRFVILIWGLSGFLWNLKDVWELIKKASTWILLLVFVVFSVWLANRSTAFPYIFDTGLYHLNVMQWAEAYPVVPGLGNLHTRLGFGGAFFLFPALIDTGFWQDKPHHIVNSFLVLSLFMHLITVGSRVFRKAKTSISSMYQLFFIPVLLIFIFRNGYIPGMSNDVPIFILGIVISTQLLELVVNKSLTTKDAFYRLFVVTLLAAIGIAIKSSFIITGGTSALLAIIAYSFRFTNTSKASVIKVSLQSGIVAGLIFIPMFARSIIMTGYPLYPSTIGAFPVEWRISTETANAETNSIRAWAMDARRQPNEVLADWAWFSPWYQRVSKNDMLRLPIQITVISALMFALAYLIRCYRFRMRLPNLLQVALLFPPLLSLIAWFFSAPDPRFAGASFWILGFVSLALLLQTITSEESIWRKRIFFTIFIILMTYPFQDFTASPWLKQKTESGLVPLPQPKVEAFTTNTGAVIWNPIDDTKKQCWLAPLPCTPYPDANLTLRDPDKLQSGFILKET